MHDYWPFAITIAVILAGILFNRQDIKEFRAEVRQDIRDFRTEVTNRLDRIESDLREFYKTLGDHGARIDILEKKR